MRLALLVAGGMSAATLAQSAALRQADGSFDVTGETHEEIGAQLAEAFLAERASEAMHGLPDTIGDPLTLVSTIDETASFFSKGFLQVRFTPRHSFRLESPLPIESVQDIDALMPLLELSGSPGEWSLRFFQSPETARWHLLSKDLPENRAPVAQATIPIENVNRQTFSVKTRGNEAPLLGGLVFHQYQPLIDASLDRDLGIPVILSGEAHGTELLRLSGVDGDPTGHYRLTVRSCSGEWDPREFPWEASPSDFALSLALAAGSGMEWHFPVVRLDESEWRVTSAPWVTSAIFETELNALEETEAQYLARLQEEERLELLAYGRSLHEQQKLRDILEKDAADRRLWLAQTDGITLVRAILTKRDLGNQLGGQLIMASLESNPMRPWLNPHYSIDWENSLVLNLRETGQIGQLRRFEFDVSAKPVGDMVPVEMWASFYLDEITVERVEIVDAAARESESASESTSKGGTIPATTLFVTSKGHRTALELEDEKRPRADREALERIGQGLFYRKTASPMPPAGSPKSNRPLTARSGNAGGLCPNGRCGG